MNRILTLLALFLLLISCQPGKKTSGEFILLPEPQEFSIKGDSDLQAADIDQYYLSDDNPLPVFGKILNGIQATKEKNDANLILSIDQVLDVNPEGYQLNITTKHISITGKDQAGLFYGIKTLEQLIQDAVDQEVPLPICSITDYPLLAYRAIHLDVKHHREKLEYYYGLMDWLGSYKINAIIVEVEDKLAYVRQPKVGSGDAFSIEEWAQLSAYALERNIELSPLVQGLGHASFVLKHEGYHDLRDNPESDWAFNPLDPKTYEVQFDLYLDALEAFPHGKYLHVGGDEVHTTGRNSGQSPLELQLNWLNKVCQFAEENDRIPIFWDDMPLKHAGVYRTLHNASLSQSRVDSIWQANEPKLVEFLDHFPKNCIYMRWNYSAPQAIGNGKAMDWFKQHGFKVMGATAGQTRWVLMPQNQSNMENIRQFALSSIETGSTGLLLTLWDDDSPHFELYKRGITIFAEYTWAGEQREKEKIKSAYRQREFSADAASADLAFIDELEHPVGNYKNTLLKGNQRNYLAGQQNPLEESVIELPDPDQPGAWSEKHADRIELAATMLVSCELVTERIAKMKELLQRNEYTLSVYEQVNKLTAFSFKALLLLDAFDRAKNDQERSVALESLNQHAIGFADIRATLEEVYGVTRVLDKPADYLLDQDHHVHLANQSINFDWQFRAEEFFIDKLNKKLLK